MTQEMRSRKNPDIRKEEILQAAIKLANKFGYTNFSREDLAFEINVSPGLITFYFGKMNDLRYELMKTAIEREILPIIAQGLSLQDKQARKINPQLKKKVLNSF